MIKNIIYYAFMAFMAASCSHYPVEVKQALKQAGKNRTELEKALEHYRQNPEDSLKYRATCYLIENMPYHFSYRSALIDTFKTTNRVAKEKKISINQAYAELVRNHGRLSYSKVRIFRCKIKKMNKKYFSYIEDKKVYDIHVMTSDFLINNIDLAFRAWQEMPYGRHYNFKEFCEYILPYRVGGEELEDWRELYYRTFKTFVDSAELPDDPVYVARMIQIFLMKKGFDFYFEDNVPLMGPVTLLNDPFGSCQEATVFTAYILRSIGIPSGGDRMLKNPAMTGATHQMSFLIDTTHQSILYNAILDPFLPARSVLPPFKLGKVYRTCYSLQKESLPFLAPKQTFLPPTLSNPFLKDVSSEYMDDNSFTIETRMVDKAPKRNRYYFLSVCDFQGWVPIDWTMSDSGRASFRNVENENVYIVLTNEGKQLTPVSYPFMLLDNSVHFIKPDLEHITDLQIERKYPMKAEAYHRMQGMVGGLFQGANREDFKDAELLWHITDFRRYCFHYVTLPFTGKKYRYFRYVAPTGKKGEVGEMAALDRKGNRMEAIRVFGTKGTEENALENIYDGDQLTYYEAEKTTPPVWAAVDFGQSTEIAGIKYICRNDDNAIRDGDQYELFYWDEGWYSLGHRMGDESHLLEFKNVPSNALYWLKNHTRGREERPFTYENEKQIWW